MQVILRGQPTVVQSRRLVPRATKKQAPKEPGEAPRRRKAASWGSSFFGLIICAALIFGWATRDRLINAESGTGYYLGIIGASGMLLLLAYPLRKYVKLLRGAGPVSFWFRLHMALGLIGPTLILYHANFGLGSTNSNVALFAMLIVAGSGLIGRFFYAKIHRGLYGRRAEARELRGEAETLREQFNIAINEKLATEMDALEASAFESARGIGRSAAKAFTTVSQGRSLKRRMNRDIRRHAKSKERKEVKGWLAAHLEISDRYFNRIEQAAELSFYERLFAAWHVLHLPLFILLILTAIIHVVAVHLY